LSVFEAEHDPSRPAEHEAGGVLTVDPAAIAANWRTLAGVAGAAECAGVVKADAYGTGIEAAVPALAAAGCRTFFVALIHEGRRVRTLVPDATVYVLNGLLPGTAPSYAQARLRPVLGSTEELAEWSAFCKAEGVDPAFGLHVDTGINRLGLPYEAAMTLGSHGLAAQYGLTPSLVMSHFVSAERPGDPLNARQIGAFGAVRGVFPGVPGSLANSSGIFLGPAARHDLVRPGYALYGGNPLPGQASPVRAVVRLEGRVMQVRDIPAGGSIGYNARRTVERPTRGAIVAIGYADGLPGGSSGFDDKPGGVLVSPEGRRCPILGRVSMDMIVVDATDCAPGEVQRGSLMALLDDSLGVDEVGARAGVIGYEVLTGLGRRYRRRVAGEA
jgi:alanine racemase